MTTSNDKIRALLLSALMVLSVFAGAIAITGASAAANRGAGPGTYSTGPADTNPGGNDASVGNIGNGETIYQGEDDITFVDGNGNTISPASLERTAGSNEGVPLQVPIPEDQATGSYSTDIQNPNSAGAFTVTVQEPRVLTLEVQNNDEADVSGGVLTTDQGDASVFVEYNYQNAENVELTVEDEDGLDVTEEILDSGDDGVLDGDGRIEINPDAVDSGEYTFTVAGVEDLDFGEASQTVAVNISSDQTASIDLDSESATQGVNTGFTVENSPEGNYHAVTIDSNELRDGVSASEAASIFRNVGDTSDTGIVVTDDNGDFVEVQSLSDTGSQVAPNALANNEQIAYAFAIVEIDGGNGVGSIETQYLDESDITVELYPASGQGTVPAYAAGGSHLDVATDVDGDGNNEDPILPNLLDTDDEQDFEVTEGDVSLTSPEGVYVVGSEVDVNGTASEGIDDVAVYARDNNDYELVDVDGDTIDVEDDESFEAEDVVLSDGNLGNSILSLPGTYRLGVIDAQDADTDGDGTPEDQLTTSDFNGGVSSTTSIRVTETELNGTFITYDGQIATEDQSIDVEGAAPGKDNVVIAFVDERGNAVAQTISVDDDSTFSEEDIDISGLSEGSVSAHILSSGRDGVFGESDSVDTESELENAIENTYAGGSSSGEQVRELITSNTIDDTASDDLIVTETFRLADGLTTIESVNSPVESDGTLTIEGQTNRVPDDTTISVEILTEDDESVTIDSTDQWDTDGEWSVSLELSDVEPGNYTVEADDGDNTDRVSVEVVESGTLEEATPEPGTDTPEPDTPEPDTDTPSMDTDTPEPDTDTPEPAATTTGDSGPGFTAAIALIALVAAALLAVRRNN